MLYNDYDYFSLFGYAESAGNLGKKNVARRFKQKKEEEKNTVLRTKMFSASIHIMYILVLMGK